MTLNAIITYITTTPTTWIAIFLIFTYLIDVSKLQINPWKWTGRMIRKGIKTFGNVLTEDIRKDLADFDNKYSDQLTVQLIQINAIQQSIGRIEENTNTLENKLNNHVAESMRRDILDYQNSVLQNRRHTKEEWTYIYRLCDKYEKYIEDNDLSNSEAEEAIAYIRKVYRTKLEGGEFILKGVLEDEN